MKFSVEMNLKFEMEAEVKDVTVDDMRKTGVTDKMFKEHLKEEIMKDLDDTLLENSDELKTKYKITRFKLKILDEEE
jgi:hypothetical protein